MPSNASAPAIIVGIGASAGGLAAFKSFLDRLPADSGMAYVLVQHLDPDHPSLLVELLAPHSRIPVVLAEQGAAVAANHVYVIPPNATLTMKDGVLQVVKPAPPRESRRPIDTFFQSLAADQGERATSIVLAGVGSDGTQGLRAIKAAGGLTMAQAEHDETALSGMPMSAAATGLVDFVLAVDAMPDKLIEHLQQLSATSEWKSAHASAEDWPRHLQEIAAQLRATIGHDFTDYKQGTLIRRVQRRMQALGIADVPDYIAALASDAHEADLLFRELLIGVTQFFRDPDAFEALAAVAIPPLLSGRDPDTPIRVWVAGCATGEEVYSIAILLQEKIDEQKSAVKLQVFGTDLDANAISVARAARYRKPMPGLSPERLARWFAQDGDHFCPAKSIREACVFSVHSLIKDPPFSKLDIVSCRNVLIYLNSELQHRVMQTFHYALKPGGFLFLGPSESATRDRSLFHVIDRKNRIMQRRDDVVPTLPGFRPMDAGAYSIPAVERPPTDVDRIDRSIRAAMERLSPAMLVINRQQDIVRFSGAGAGRYLEPSAGQASLNLFALLSKNLRPIIRECLLKAVAGPETVTANDVFIAGPPEGLVSVTIEPIESGLVIIAFREAASGGAQPVSSGTSAPEGTPAERELLSTKAQLKAAVGQLETHIEEFRSATEEMQSVNEELQSANEELETAKEEMQSVNEELQTVNSELSGKNELLGRLNDDLTNLLDSTRIATLFLDRELRVRSFTPAMTEIFHLREGDRGRPITEIVSRLAYGDLERDVETVQKTLAVVEHEVHPKTNGSTFLMRIRPYRTRDDRLDGVVLTFVDVTEMKQAARARQDLEQSFRLAQEAAGIGSWRWDLRTDLIQCTAENERLMGYGTSDGPLSYRRLLARVHPDDAKSIEEVLAECRQSGADWEQEFRVMHSDGVRWLQGKGHVIRDPDGHPLEMIGVNLDITERKAQQDHVHFLLHELDHRAMNLLSVAVSLITQGIDESDNVAEFARRCTARLHALGESQRLLSKRSWTGADLASIVQGTLAPYLGDFGARASFEGPPVFLRSKAVESIGLALGELTTNAAKYGALSGQSGRVDVRWEIRRDGERRGWLHMTWRESGGPTVVPPARECFGTKVIKTFPAFQLSANVSLTYPPEGVCWMLDLSAVHYSTPPAGEPNG